MANLAAFAMKSLGVNLGLEGANSSRIEEAFALVEGKKIVSTLGHIPNVITMPHSTPDKTGVLDLNLTSATFTTGAHLIDGIPEYEARAGNHVLY